MKKPYRKPAVKSMKLEAPQKTDWQWFVEMLFKRWPDEVKSNEK
jgi:hypothetical protein